MPENYLKRKSYSNKSKLPLKVQYTLKLLPKVQLLVNNCLNNRLGKWYAG